MLRSLFSDTAGAQARTVSDKYRQSPPLAGLAMLALWVCGLGSATAQETDELKLPTNRPILMSVIEQAKASAAEEYQPDDHGLDEKLKNMDYQPYRSIRFDAEKALWHGSNDYEVQFFHPGFLYDQPVTINVVEYDNSQQQLDFDPAMFRYEQQAKQYKGLIDKNSGFAGFRVHYPIKSDEYKDEFAVLQGAS